VSIPDSSNRAVQSREILDLMVPTVVYLRFPLQIEASSMPTKTSRKAAIFRRQPLTMPTHLVIAAPKDTGHFSKDALDELYERYKSSTLS
jgi:hypothetical protein